MATCRDCEQTIVWIRSDDGRWLPPYEPTLEFANGEYILMDGDGTALAMPQVFKRHHCPAYQGVTPEELAARRLRREQEKEERRLERRRLLDEAHERRRKEREETERQRQYNFALASFPKRVLPVACPECDAPGGEPCRTGERAYAAYRGTPHEARKRAAPPPKRYHRVKATWGEDYTGPWPPEPEGKTYYYMRSWLAENFTIFDPDGYRERDWLIPQEASQMTRWLRHHANLLLELDDRHVT